MTLKEFIDATDFTVAIEGNTDTELSEVFCCDLLSIAMAHGPAGCIWVTVMANVNTLAVMTLCDCGVLLLAEDVHLDEAASKKAQEEGITVLETPKGIFPAALAAHEALTK